MTDYLSCTRCGRETDTDIDSLYDDFSTTKKGTPRKRSGWARALQALVTDWMCDNCLTDAEKEIEDDN